MKDASFMSPRVLRELNTFLEKQGLVIWSPPDSPRNERSSPLLVTDQCTSATGADRADEEVRK